MDALMRRWLAEVVVLEALWSLNELWNAREVRRRKKSRSRWERATIVYRMAPPPLFWGGVDPTDVYAYFLKKSECEAHVLNLELQVGVEFGFPRPVVAVNRARLGRYIWRDPDSQAFYVTPKPD